MTTRKCQFRVPAPKAADADPWSPDAVEQHGAPATVLLHVPGARAPRSSVWACVDHSHLLLAAGCEVDMSVDPMTGGAWTLCGTTVSITNDPTTMPNGGVTFAVCGGCGRPVFVNDAGAYEYADDHGAGCDGPLNCVCTGDAAEART